MQRRHLLQGLAGLLGLAAAPKAPADIITRMDAADIFLPSPTGGNLRRKTVLELLMQGRTISGIAVALCDVEMRLPGVPLNESSLTSLYYFDDLLPDNLACRGVARNACLIESERSGRRHVWVDSSDITFEAVSFEYACGLLVGLEFDDGSIPAVSFLTDGRSMFGLPVNPNGGSVHLRMPPGGLVRIA